MLTLGERCADTVITYFHQANTPEIRRMLPLKAQTVEEALADYARTLLPGATSYGRTILLDGVHVGDVWCYGIDLGQEPNCMISYCVFARAAWSKGIATKAVKMFVDEICARYGVKQIGAFTYASNGASIRVLEKNGFALVETFEEDGEQSLYYQYERQ